MYLHTNCSVTINHSVPLSLVSEHHEPAVTSRNVFGVALLVWLIFCEKSMLQTFSISRVVTVLILLKSLPKSLPICALYSTHSLEQCRGCEQAYWSARECHGAFLCVFVSRRGRLILWKTLYCITAFYSVQKLSGVELLFSFAVDWCTTDLSSAHESG